MKIYPYQILISNQFINNTFEQSLVYKFNEFNVIINQKNSSNLIIKDDLLFFGECFDSENITFTNHQIIENLSAKSFNEKLKLINKLSGFYYFMIIEDDKIIILNDASSQYEIFYFNKDNKIIFASQPNLIFPFLTEEEQKIDEKAPDYIIKNKINIFDKTPFLNIYTLSKQVFGKNNID